MHKQGFEWKVGIFVAISLVMAAALILRFSKGTPLFTKSYELRLKTGNVGGIRPGAGVLMAGVEVGNVESVTLDEDGRTVTVRTRISSQYRIHSDALFSVEQANFLGDQYIFVTPTENKGRELKDGDEVICQAPFNIQEIARSGAVLIRRLDQTAENLNAAVARVDRTLLAEETLTNLTVTVANFRLVSERALQTIRGMDVLVQSNSHPMSVAVSNLVTFSEDLHGVTRELELTLGSNREAMTSSMKNIESASLRLDKLLQALQAGEGLAGSLLHDPQLQSALHQTMENLSLLSSNLNKYGLLWKPKVKKTNTVSYPGKSAFQ